MASQTKQVRKMIPGLTPVIDAINGNRADFGTLTDPTHQHTATTTPIIESRVAFFNGPKLAELVSIVNTVDAANGVQILLLQPDWPRKVQLRIINAGTAITAGTLDIVGIGARGQANSESISLTGGTATKISTKAYAHITSATVTGLVGGGAGQSISLGLAAALGLPGPKALTPTTWAVYKANVDKLDEAVSTVDATEGTVIPTTTADGTKTFTFWYNFTYTPLNPSTGLVATGITTAVGGTSHFHMSGIDSIAAAAASTDLATSIAAVNELAILYQYSANINGPFPGHVNDTLAHPVLDTVNVLTAPLATDLATAITLANQLYTAYNAHLTQSTIHINNDGTNTASSATATIQSELNTRIVDLKAKMNAHWADGLTGGSIRWVSQ